MIICFFPRSLATGLEDFFWILSLVDVIAFIAWKQMSRISWSQWIYLLFGSVLLLVLAYILATAASRMVFDDNSSAHWNAHARFTQAAIQGRLKEEEHAVTTVAPPKMGGAKLNIRYTVGDVPLAQGRHNSGSGVAGAAAAAATAGAIAPTFTAASSIIGAIGGVGGGGGGTCSSSHSSTPATSSPVNEPPSTTATITTSSTSKAKKKSPLAMEKVASGSTSGGGGSGQRESIVPEPIIEEEDRIESPSFLPEES